MKSLVECKEEKHLQRVVAAAAAPAAIDAALSS